jgi:hypothetical protein
MRPSTAWARRLAAVGLVGVAVVAALLALDVHAWGSGLDRGDARYARAPQAARWTASTLLPGDPAGSLLEVEDDLSARDALRLARIAFATPRGFDNGHQQAETRARAEVALSDVAASGTPAQASQAGNLLGVLIESAGDQAADDRAQAAFDGAIRALPANEDAKYNLELLLRRQRVVGTREGQSKGSGARGASRRGAGAGTPGQGY